MTALERILVFSQAVSNSDYYTGVAVVNPGVTDAQVRIELTDGKSGETAAQTVKVKAGGRSSGLLTEYFPSLTGRELSSGFVRVSSDKNLTAYAVIGTRNLSVLSANPAQGN